LKKGTIWVSKLPFKGSGLDHNANGTNQLAVKVNANQRFEDMMKGLDRERSV